MKQINMKHIKLFEGFLNENFNSADNGPNGADAHRWKKKEDKEFWSKLTHYILKAEKESNPNSFIIELSKPAQDILLKIANVMLDNESNTNEGREVMVADMDVEAAGLVDEIKDSLDFASTKLYDLKKMSDYIKNDYPELSKDIADVVEPMMIELENEYPQKLQALLKKFK